MPSVIAAVLDVCVLFPASLRDTLLRAGQRDMYRMTWTDMILEEMRRNLVKNGKMNDAQSQRLVRIIQTTFPRAQVIEEYASLIDTMTNHPKDRHVLAAAVATDAQVIVTFNLRDFPQTALAPFAIEAQSPDSFLCHLLSQDQTGMLAVITEQAQALRNPSLTVTEVLSALAVHIPEFAQRIRPSLLNA